jgi:hypothetical protein
MNPVEILSGMSEAQFTDLVLASPKKFREEVFRRAGIKAKAGSAFSLSDGKKNEVRVKRLFGAVQEGFVLGDQIAEELIRNYLYTRRELLADALDFFSVPHDHGLTNADLAFVNDIGPDKGNELRALLSAKHREQDVELYLKFMNIQFS